MSSAPDQDISQQALALLEKREDALCSRERQLTDELTVIANERRAIQNDREILEKARAIHARLFASANADLHVTLQAAEVDKVQARARIGPQRYAILKTLQVDGGKLISEFLAAATGLPITRVREQLKSDAGVYVEVEQVNMQSPALWRLTPAGDDLLRRFERYRTSQGKPLPSLTPGASDLDDEEIDPAHSKSGEAGVQGPKSTTVKPVGEVVHDNTNLTL